MRRRCDAGRGSWERQPPGWHPLPRKRQRNVGMQKVCSGSWELPRLRGPALNAADLEIGGPGGALPHGRDADKAEGPK
jgi:hypothetical protein